MLDAPGFERRMVPPMAPAEGTACTSRGMVHAARSDPGSNASESSYLTTFRPSLCRYATTYADTTLRDSRHRFWNIEIPPSCCASGLEPEHDFDVAFLSRAITKPILAQ